MPFHGGVETYVASAAGALAAEGAEVTVITQVPRYAELPLQEVRDGYTVERHHLPISNIWDAPSLSAARAASRAGRFDVVWVHTYHSPLAWLVAEQACTPVVFTPHYHGVGHTRLRHGLHVAYRPAGRRLMAASKRVVAVTDAEANLLQRDFPRELHRKLGVIPTAVPDPIGGRHPFPNDSNVVLTVARQEPYKRTDLLIRAIAELRRREVSARLVVVGDGDGLRACRRLAAEQGAVDVVSFTGAVDDETLARWWASASVYASASQQEAFGIGVAQALVAGLPVIASNIPAHRELIFSAGPGAAAQLCDITDTDDDTAATFANAIAQLLPYGNACPERAQRCMLPSTAEMVDQLLETLLEARDMVHRP
jgi:glycosyltransferase involved in cell wall biosynthesis